MFKLKDKNLVVLIIDEKTPMPPSADFVMQAFEHSEFCDCYFFKSEVVAAFKEANFSELVVAEKRDATLEIEISDDQMSATATLHCAQGGEILTPESAKQQIETAGISQGLIDEHIEKLLGQQFESLPGSSNKAQIAKGKAPIAGKDGYLEKHVTTLAERMRTPKRNEDGSVDMRDFGKLASVKEGALLITRHLATLGTHGFNICGVEIEATPGKDCKLAAGDGTELDQKNNNLLKATISGVPVDNHNGMRVDDVFTIADVNVKSGHIDFDGSIIITHNVEPGMKVTANGDINVFGTVESAELRATGSIEIKQGCIGHQKADEQLSCVIHCKGNLEVSHAQYTYLAGNNITINKQVSHCHIKAKNHLEIGVPKSKQGKLIGGKVLDCKTMNCGEIGTEKGAPTVVMLGQSAVRLKEKADEVFNKIRSTHKALEQLESEFDKALMVEDAEQQQQLLIDISDQQSHCEKLIELLPSHASKFESATHFITKFCQLDVSFALHQNVELRIFNKVFKTARPYPPLSAHLEKNKIELTFKTSK